MDWKIIVSEINQAGMSQRKIAAEVGLSQPSICELMSGKIKSPLWESGDALLRIHRQVMQAKKRANNRKGKNHG